MANWRSVVFQVPEARLLADLAGVDRDLHAVEEYCDRFLEERSKEQPDWTVLEALCSAVVVRYGRALPSGVRAGVPIEVIHSLEPDYQAWHQYFKDARDKWIAHSVNTFEENEVCAWLMPPERGPLGVTSITVRQHRVAALSSEAITALRLLAVAVRGHIKQLADAENAKVLALAQSLPPEPFYSQQDAARLPGEDHPGKVRGGR